MSVNLLLNISLRGAGHALVLITLSCCKKGAINPHVRHDTSSITGCYGWRPFEVAKEGVFTASLTH